MTDRSWRPALASALFAAALLAAAAPAGAAVKRFLPTLFKERNNFQDSYRSPANVGSRSGTSQFWAPLTLPVGAVITGVSYWHSGTGAAPPTSSLLIGYDVVDDEPKWDPYGVAAGTSSAVTGAPPTIEVDAAVYGGSHKVKANRRYWVTVTCAAGASVWEVDVTYSEP